MRPSCPSGRRRKTRAPEKLNASSTQRGFEWRTTIACPVSDRRAPPGLFSTELAVHERPGARVEHRHELAARGGAVLHPGRLRRRSRSAPIEEAAPPRVAAAAA